MLKRLMLAVLLFCTLHVHAQEDDVLGFDGYPNMENIPDPTEAAFKPGGKFSLTLYMNALIDPLREWLWFGTAKLDGMVGWFEDIEESLEKHRDRIKDLEDADEEHNIPLIKGTIEKLDADDVALRLYTDYVRSWAGSVFVGHKAKFKTLDEEQTEQDAQIKTLGGKTADLETEVEKLRNIDLGVYAIKEDAATDHDHDDTYSKLDHNHDDTYQPIGNYLTADDLPDYDFTNIFNDYFTDNPVDAYTKEESDGRYYDKTTADGLFLAKSVFDAHMLLYHYGYPSGISPSPAGDFGVQ